MKRHIGLIYSLAIISIVSVLAFAEGSASKLPRLALADDSAIQKCIEDKLAASATLKSDGISVSVPYIQLPVIPQSGRVASGKSRQLVISNLARPRSSPLNAYTNISAPTLCVTLRLCFHAHNLA